MTKFVITFQPDGKRVKIDETESILIAAQKGGVDITSICGGKGTCGKCRVLIEPNSPVNPLTVNEKELFSDEDIETGMRLACLTKAAGNLTVKIPEISRTGKQRLQIEGIETPVEVDPNVKKYFIELKSPSLEDTVSDLDRLKQALETKDHLTDLKINYDLLKILGTKIRECNWQITAVLWNNEIIELEKGNTLDKLYGYAFDIGTTKLAGYLVDLNTGNVIAAGSLMNPQIPYGEDVIARLNHQEPRKLNMAVVEGINEILDGLLEKTGIERYNVYEMTAVGNTIMHHLFLNINAKNLGYAPYPAVSTEAVTVEAKAIGININPRGKVYFLPTIAAFVGADTIGVILATEIYKSEETCLALDIGTNTEVVLGNKDRMLTCSCASGPAFEGAHIEHGMRAASGAIEKVSIDPESLEIKLQTIDNTPPVGICGSGMIDLMAEMLKAGIIDVRGTFYKDKENSKIRKGENGWELLVSPKDENDIQSDLVFSQGDIRQITLAKSAMQTGIRILLKYFNNGKDQIDKLFLAGAFGSHINKESARMIGIYPEIDFKKVITVGNAAGTGARMCLVSKDAKKIVEEFSNKVDYIELAADEGFQNEFLNSSYIPFADLDEYPEVTKILQKYGNFPKKLPRKF